MRHLNTTSHHCQRWQKRDKKHWDGTQNQRSRKWGWDALERIMEDALRPYRRRSPLDVGNLPRSLTLTLSHGRICILCSLFFLLWINRQNKRINFLPCPLSSIPPNSRYISKRYYLLLALNAGFERRPNGATLIIHRKSKITLRISLSLPHAKFPMFATNFSTSA